MESSTEPKIRSEEGKHLLPELAYEARISVWNDHLRHSVQPEYLIDEQTGVLGGCYLLGAGEEMHHLSQAVHEDCYGGLAIRLW